MANDKLILELKETPVSLGGREFVLREMSGAKQNKFYPMCARLAKLMNFIQELELKESELSSEQAAQLAQARDQLKGVNEEIWTLILNPADDNRDRITSEWLDNFANDRLGEAILHEQMTLNRFDSVMGKLMAQAAPQGAELGIQDLALAGSATAAPLAESITSTL